MYGAAGLALGFGVAGFYLLPAAYEQRWVNIGQALSTGLLPSENFLFTVINDPEHTLFNWMASSIAVLLIALTGLAAVAARRAQQERDGAWDGSVWRTMLLLAGLATFFMMRFTAILWEVLPKLRFVQFPWRWMSLLAVPFAVFLGSVMGRKRSGWVWVVVTFALISGSGAVLAKQGWWDSEDIPGLRRAIAHGEGFDGTDEYDSAGDEHSDEVARGDGDGHGFHAWASKQAGVKGGSLESRRQRGFRQHARTVFSWAAFVELSRVASGGERHDGRARERRRLQPNDCARAGRRISRARAVHEDSRPDTRGRA